MAGPTWISPVYPQCSFSLPGSRPVSHITFCCYFSLVSSNLWLFLSLSLFMMIPKSRKPLEPFKAYRVLLLDGHSQYWGSHHQDHSRKLEMIWLYNRCYKGNMCRHRKGARWCGSYTVALTVRMRNDGSHCSILIWIWANNFIFLGLSFLLCNVGIIAQISG